MLGMISFFRLVFFASAFAYTARCLEAERIPVPIITISTGLRPRLTTEEDSNWWRCFRARYLDFFGTSYVASAQLAYSDSILQHHSSRENVPVLCVDGLCATEYHLLLVDGEDMSMGSYCRLNSGTCITSKTSVNALKAIANEVGKTRQKHVYITSYDIRLPFWMTWVMQGIEDFFELFMETIGLPGLTTAAAVAAADARNMMYFGGDRDL